ncbi:MAG: GNAT family N-acetyltransferase [bacterium]|nr:GNAT family N-acetyltransferase [bacterium]
MSELKIRRATRADVPILVEFNRALARESEGRELDPERLTRGVEGVFGGERGRYLIAERAGEAVGGLMLTTEWSDWRDGWFWWIQSVYTVVSARRTGVYRALYDRVLNEARERDDVCGVRLYVENENYVAKRTYEVLGMDASSYQLYEVDFLMTAE